MNDRSVSIKTSCMEKRIWCQTKREEDDDEEEDEKVGSNTGT